MQRAATSLGLALALAATVSASTPGFITDFAEAKAEALDTGKLIFVYFNLPM